MLERNRWIKGVPNSLTLCNSLCGFASILITLQAYKFAEDPAKMADIFAISAIMILFAMVFDALDGFAARLLNAGSMHGLQMDSLADMTTFGVAPATLVAVMAHNVEQLDTLREYVPICLLCAVYLGCAALRLATYNVHAMLEKKSDDKFHGLPSPGAAAAICTTVLFYNKLGISHTDYWWVIPVYGAVLGFLMVSPVRYLHIGKWLVSAVKSKRKMAIVLVFLILAILSPVYTGFIFINVYILLGLLIAFWNLLTGKNKEA